MGTPLWKMCGTFGSLGGLPGRDGPLEIIRGRAVAAQLHVLVADLGGEPVGLVLGFGVELLVAFGKHHLHQRLVTTWVLSHAQLVDPGGVPVILGETFLIWQRDVYELDEFFLGWCDVALGKDYLEIREERCLRGSTRNLNQTQWDFFARRS